MGVQYKNSTAAKVEKFLQNHVGEKFKLGEIIEQGKFKAAQTAAIRQKIEKLQKIGKLERVAVGLYQVKPAILKSSKAGYIKRASERKIKSSCVRYTSAGDYTAST